MKEKAYELIEHTADIGIKVKAKSLRSLFENAAAAMFDIIAEKRKAPKTAEKIITIKQKADNLEELFINWLNEVLSVSATEELIFSKFQIHKLNTHNLEATLGGRNFGNYKINKEIKAATYHELKLEQFKSGWLAEVIFDV